MSNFEKNMSEIFDVPGKLVEVQKTEVVPYSPTDKSSLESDLDQDYEESRKTYKEIGRAHV